MDIQILLDAVYDVLQYALVALLPVLAGMAVAWLKSQINVLKGKLTEQQSDILDAAVRIAVLAAEQLNLAGFIEDKKAEAVRIAQQYLAAHNVYVDIDVIVDAIEAAVLDELNRDKALPTG